MFWIVSKAQRWNSSNRRLCPSKVQKDFPMEVVSLLVLGVQECFYYSLEGLKILCWISRPDWTEFAKCQTSSSANLIGCLYPPIIVVLVQRCKKC
jgi:hypothetical protein